MRNLKKLNIEDNPLTFPPEEIIKNGQEATLRFLLDFLTQGEREVYEVKMLILGRRRNRKDNLMAQTPEY